jgi:hypothetical protein
MSRRVSRNITYALFFTLRPNLYYGFFYRNSGATGRTISKTRRLRRRAPLLLSLSTLRCCPTPSLVFALAVGGPSFWSPRLLDIRLGREARWQPHSSLSSYCTTFALRLLEQHYCWQRIDSPRYSWLLRVTLPVLSQLHCFVHDLQSWRSASLGSASPIMAQAI